jgi:hypothetical protein
MTTENQMYIAIAALAAIGVYFYAKKNTELMGWKKGYTVLQDQINSGTPAQVTQ